VHPGGCAHRPRRRRRGQGARRRDARAWPPSGGLRGVRDTVPVRVLRRARRAHPPRGAPVAAGARQRSNRGGLAPELRRTRRPPGDDGGVRRRANPVYFPTGSFGLLIEDEHGSLDRRAPSDELFVHPTNLIRPLGPHLYGWQLYEAIAPWETSPE